MFRISGIALDDGRPVRLEWRGPAERERPLLAPLVGDELIALQVNVDARQGVSYPATATGPDVLVDLDQPWSVALAIGARLRTGAIVEGDTQRIVYALPDGAEG